MTLRDFIAEAGDRTLKENLYEFYLGALRRVPKRYLGPSVYTRDWDVLVIMDACRVDLLRGVADEYDFVEDVDSVRSIAGTSKPFMERTFIERYVLDVSRTNYITGNPFSSQVFENAHPFRSLQEAWREDWDEDLGTIRPEPLTQRALDTHDPTTDDRTIVHYMQPHVPFIGRSDLHTGFDPEGWARGGDGNLWTDVRDGEVTYEEAWEGYENNLRLVLDSVADLVDGLPSEHVVLTADHGNAIGDLGVYGHEDIPVPEIMNVPWVDVGTTREEEPESAETDEVVAERLESLGYK